MTINPLGHLMDQNHTINTITRTSHINLELRHFPLSYLFICFFFRFMGCVWFRLVANEVKSTVNCYFKIVQKSKAKVIIRYVEIKCQLDATEVFIVDLIACSTCFGHHYAHHQELKSIIQWLLPVVFRAVVFKLLVWCGAEGYVSCLQDAGKPAIKSAIKTSVASSWHFISTY